MPSSPTQTDLGSDTRNYDAESIDLPEQGRKYAYAFDDRMRHYMMRTFNPLFPAQTKRCLELGCYTGQLTKILSSTFPHVTAVDASQGSIEQARQRVGKATRFIGSTFESLDLDERFDVVFIIHTLEHVDDPISVLQRSRSWLSEGGRLFVAVPNANAASRQIAVKMGLIDSNRAVTDPERKQGHRITYALDTLERDVSAAGLQVVQRGGVFFKSLANFQFDQFTASGMLNDAYLEGCYQLGMHYPDLCASIYMVCERGKDG